MAKHILLINGPNLNLLGLREPHIYGTTTLSSLESSLRSHCASLSPPVHLTTYQSNHEGAIIDMIHRSRYPELVPSSILDSAASSQTVVKEDNREKTKGRGGMNGIEKTQEVEETQRVKEEAEGNDESSSLPPISYILINPGALTHTSVALRDALAGVAIPFLEIHITNVHAREEFRHKSYLSDKAVAVVCGLGVWGYRVAVDYCVEQNV